MVTVLHVKLFYVINQAIHNLSTFRQEERASRSDWIKEEQPERSTQLAVVALFSFFDSLKIVLLGVARLPCSTVYALQHCVVFVTPPVCPGSRKQLVRLDVSSASHMTTTAEIFKRSIGVATERDSLVGWDSLKDLYFIFVVLDQFKRFVAGGFTFNKLCVRSDRIAHFEFNLF